MKIDSYFVRRFDEELFWKLYKISIGSGLKAIVCKVLCMRMASKNAGYIGRETVLKGPIKFPHGFNGVHILRWATIGKNCTIFQNVTIGSRSMDAPVIGDNCLIGAGAIILGDVKVGDNVKIGAGAIVVEDIPNGATVVGSKARILLRKSEI